MTESFPPSLSMDRASESIKRSTEEALRRRRKENQHFNGVWPAHDREHLARRVHGARGTTLPRMKISRVLRAMERISQKRLDDFCELV
jgi:hypothetical protein